MVSLKVCRDFAHYLDQRYHSKPQRLYDPDWLWENWQVYWNFLKKYAHPRLTQCTDLQWRAYEISIKEPESIDKRTRRGGKSLSFANLMFFFALIRFGKYEGKVMYRCPFADQLKQLLEWARKNPFYDRYSSQTGEIKLNVNRPPINANKYSDATCASQGIDVLLGDEEKKIPTGSALDAYAHETRGTLIEGSRDTVRIIHKSTGGAFTFFHVMLEALEDKQERTGKQCVIVIPYTECPWITEESIEEEAQMNLDAPYWIDQEYRCIDTIAGGNFFDQEKLHIEDMHAKFDKMNLPINAGGLDWNGDIVGHILEYGHYDGYENLYILGELRFSTVDEVHRWCKEHPYIVEVEGKPKSDGYNAGFSDNLQSKSTPCSYQSWTGEDGQHPKQVRLGILQRMNIWVDPSCKWFIRNFKEATYDPKALIPTLLKTSTQHGLDGVLHMIHAGGKLDFVRRTESYTRLPDIDRIRAQYGGNSQY